MFTRLLVGLDGSPRGDVALEQAVVLGQRFRSTILAAHVREHGEDNDGARLLDGARERVLAARLAVETVETHGAPEVALAELATGVDAVLVGRRGAMTTGAALGPTAAALIRMSGPSIIVCAGTASLMRSCAVAFDGRETSVRALNLAARFASVTGATLHVIHAAADRDAGLQVVGVAEASLSLQRVPFVTHVEAGRPEKVVEEVLKRTRCDGLFAGAHASADEPVGASSPSPSHAEEIVRRTAVPVVVQS